MVTKIPKDHTSLWKARLASIFAAAVAFMAAVSTSTAGSSITKEKVVAAIPRMEELANKAIASGGVPGTAIAVVYKDEVVYLGGFGVREAGKADAVDADTVFQLASLSKPISSTIVAALVGDGTVSWDSRISDLDPAFQLHDAYPTRRPSAISSPIAAVCRGTPATTLKASAFRVMRSCLDCTTSSRPVASVRATHTAISGLPKAQLLPLSQQVGRGRIWPKRSFISLLA